MVNEYISRRVSIWAMWVMKRHDSGLGYPKKSNFVKDVGGSFWTPEMDGEAWEVNQCVMALSPDRKNALIYHYTKSGTKEQKSQLLGCSIRTFDARVAMALNDILGYLNDIAAGIELPVIEIPVESRKKYKRA